MTDSEYKFVILLFYKYVSIDDPKRLADDIRFECEKNNLLGRVIVSGEGINATLDGTSTETESFLKWLKTNNRFSDINIKTSKSQHRSFPKLSVKVKSEIVSTKFPKEMADPERKTARRISVDELRSWYENDKDFAVVDMRNSFEIASGYFKKTVDPKLRASRDLPHSVENLSYLKDKTVVTVCTGGVRCEKMSAFLENSGFKDVYQLDGGIHTYMEKYPGKDYLGTLYTFDGRVTMDFGGERQIVGKCLLCGGLSERYVNCAKLSCHFHFIACEKCAPTNETAFCSENCRTIS